MPCQGLRFIYWTVMRNEEQQNYSDLRSALENIGVCADCMLPGKSPSDSEQ